MKRRLSFVVDNLISVLGIMSAVWLFVFLVVFILGSAFYVAVALLKWIMGI